jgi:hypothetical protein
MTDKKKEKASASKPKLSPDSKPFEVVTPSQLSSQDLILRNSPLQMVNRYTTLGTTISPRPTIQSTLVSRFDPLMEESTLPKPFISPRRIGKTSPYHAKTPSHNLFFVEPDFSHLKTLEAITKAYIYIYTSNDTRNIFNCTD